MQDNAKFIGAAVITTENGSQTNYNIIGERLCSDQFNTLVFGLGNAKNIIAITIKDSKGNSKVLENVAVNTTTVVDTVQKSVSL
jgi:hypothetical protein